MKTRLIIPYCLLLSLGGTSALLANGGAVFTVSPTGVDDTANLQAAFDAAKAAGPGSVVELEAGDFYLSDAVQVENFSGTLIGQGAEQTVLRIKPGILFPASAYDPGLSALWGYDWYMPVMLVFMYVPSPESYDLRLEHFGIHLVGKGETWNWALNDADFICPVMVSPSEASAICNVSTRWHALTFQGDEDAQYMHGCNTADCIYLSGCSGNHSITACSFDTSLGNAVLGPELIGGQLNLERVVMRSLGAGFSFYFCRDAEIAISHVEAYDLDRPTLTTYFLENCTVGLTGLTAHNAPGALVIGGVESPSAYLFEHNQINTAADGIVLQDLDPVVKSQFVLRKNRIYTEGEASIPVLTGGVVDSAIENNRITGMGSAAMMLGAGGDDHGLLVRGNNIQQWEGTLPIWLGPETSGIVVLGSGDLRQNVIDETDNMATPEYDGANVLAGINMGQHDGLPE